MSTQLTAAQVATFKTAIKGDANLTALLAGAKAQAIADYYNTVPASPTNVWRKDVPATEVVSAVVFSEFVALTAIKQAGLNLIVSPGAVDATSANVRSSFAAIFANGAASITNLTAIAQRAATRFEALFAVSQVSPLYGKACSLDDVAAAVFNDDGSVKP